MVARNLVDGLSSLVHRDAAAEAFLLDVREPLELVVEKEPQAVNIPISQLRARPDELPNDRPIHVICRSGQRAHYAVQMLRQRGFDARHVAGRMLARAILSSTDEGMEYAVD